MPEEQLQAQPAAASAELNEFEALMTKEFKPKTAEAKSAVKLAVQTLAEQAVAASALISDNAIKTIEAIIAEIDRKLTEQVNLILHHEDFKSLEGSWRGLHYLVNNTETGENLKIRVMNISKKEVAKTLKKYKGTAWDQSPLFKKLYEEEFGMPGGQPYGCLMGDYYFDHSAPDVEMLAGIAQIAAAAHAPFISAASPSLLNMESWQELSNPRDLAKIFSTPAYAAWRSLRQSDDARYLGLTMPRVLGRMPYGAKTNPVEEFEFEEETNGADHNKYVWTNAAYSMATNITRAFKLYGWCARIRGAESGGMVEGLPVHSFPTDDGGVDMKCPTEIGITDRREAELSKLGFLPLCHYKGSDYAVFFGSQTTQKPKKYDSPDATANAAISARLPYIMATARFAHYLKVMGRDKIGSFMEASNCETWLNNWIRNYVNGNPDASADMKAQYPLAEAKVTVTEVPGAPGSYNAVAYLRPWLQMEELTASMRLVARIPQMG